ncbi:hypothetical protein ACIBCT_05185 [Streptosporangium sp. NPDC050855]|uniref:hypothetical protein n=1 Tax=Streptosporangium sp. NPDC050855 TaxID=3366194 RepID=UPI00378D15D3
MPNPRPVAALVAGTLLLAACGAGRTTPAPTAAPAPGTATPRPATPRDGTPPVPSPGGTGSSAPVTDPSATAAPSATGQVAASSAWTGVEGADLPGSTALLDVAATGPRDAWAVGYQDGAEDREGTPAVLRWNGSRWREVAVGDDTGAHHLEGVSAGGPRDVWVVGNGPSAFAAHWDGRDWTPYQPFGVAEDYRLADVATSDGGAWFAANGPSGAVVLEAGDGGFRNALSTEGTLRGITSRQGHVWAVGTSAARTPLVWHGTAGSWESPGTPPVPGGVLNRVWQVSPTEVWAVGQVSASARARPPAEDANPLVMRWDGSRWTRVEVPVARGALHGVTATGPGDVWISGVDADHAGQVLVLHFDGTSWSREYGPLLRAHASGQQYEGTDDIAATGLTRVPGTGTLWAVGSVGVGDDEKAFVLRR